MIKRIFTIVLFLSIVFNAECNEPIISKIYKQIDTITLKMDLHYPAQFKEGQQRPAIIFFFGGGWNGGSIEQFRPHAEYFAERGIIAVLADYRVKNRHGTSPFDAVRDAKSSIRYLRKHHKALGIDPDKIIASGGSAGGHLAAATGNIAGLEEANEDHSISSKANALVLFNPVYDNGPDQYGYERMEGRHLEISPKHNIKKGAPPTIVFFGTEDPLVTPATAKSYEAAMKAVGSKCETFFYEGQGHGFFNFRNQIYYRKTVFETDRFLESLGYLQGQPTINPKIKVVVWDERQKKQLATYPNYLGNHIADQLKQNKDLEVHSVALDDPEQGLSEATLKGCDVMIWWGHVRHGEVSDTTSKKLVQRVKDGNLNMIFLHSAHWASPYIEAMNEATRQQVEGSYAHLGNQVDIQYNIIPDSTRYQLPKLGDRIKPATYERKYPNGKVKVFVDMPLCVFPFVRADGKPSTMLTLKPDHPIAKGIPEQFTINSTEVYDAPYHVPTPDESIFEERWGTGEWFPSGSLWNIGKGQVFYFRPGHETYKVFFEPLPLKIIENAILYMAN